MSTSLRLLSIDARAFGRDRVALARAVAAAEVDVACVHGSPHLLRWRSISAAIARRAGLVVVTGGRTAGANLVLSTLGVDVVTVCDVRFAGGSALGGPGAALAALRLRGSDFVVAAASLAGNGGERVAQVRELERELAGLVPGEQPAVICAEGAERPEAPAWQALVENRVGVAGQLFVDGRLTVAAATELTGPRPAVTIHLEI